MVTWSGSLSNISVYMVGIKGTGMTAFAELLLAQGARVSGSDVSDTFYTDAILEALQVPVFQGFSLQNVPESVDLVVYSAAYDLKSHVELVECQRRAFAMLEYTEALGAFSKEIDSSGISGVHGKTTTTAMVGTLVKSLGLHGSILVGSGVSNFNGRSTYSGGRDFFVAETCEYRRHFLRFFPKRIVLTSVEKDHLDYFKDEADIDQAFVDYVMRLPEMGLLIYCSDDEGAVRVANQAKAKRPDLQLIDYGFSAKSDFAIENYRIENGRQVFELPSLKTVHPGLGEIRLLVPGKHNVRNATAAIALMLAIYSDKIGSLSPQMVESLCQGIGSFAGTKRRGEIIGEIDGITIVDDYGHHPTAIETTLEGFRDFFPGRRIILSFMSHTYSRTEALFTEFARSFGAADLVLLHDIYASARETKSNKVTGLSFYAEAQKYHKHVHYIAKHEESTSWVLGQLRPGDVFITMGAGDNWKLGLKVLEALKGQSK